MKKEKVKKSNSLPDYSELFEGTNKKSITSKLLRGFLKENKKNFFVSCIYCIIKNAGLWAVPIITANVIDIATNPSDNSLFTLFINGFVLIFLLVQNLFSHVKYIDAVSSALRDIGAGLRNSLVKKLQQLSITYHKQMKTGALQSKFVRDVEAVEQLLNRIIIDLIPCIMTLLITVGVTFSKSKVVLVFFAALIPANVFIMRFFYGKIGKENNYFRHEVEHVSADLTQMLEMIPVTKAHGLEQTEVKKMESSLESLKKAGKSLDKVQARFASSAWVISMVMSALCLIFTGFLAYIGKISVGDVVLYQSYFTTISNNLMSLLNMYPEFSKGFESIKSMSEVMLSDQIEDDEGKITLRFVHGSVEFKNVSYQYPDDDKEVIKDFCLTVEPGDTVAFVGESGSGKSTVMNMIIGFLMPTKGEILIDGKPIEELSLNSYRTFLSVVPQNSILFNGSIKDNILYGIKDYQEEKLFQVLKSANINQFTDLLSEGIDTIIEEHGANLSGGQKQRISIARALMRDSKIIILDEATSALDNISEYHVQKAMSNLIKNRTTFIVAHRLSTIREANKIVVMKNGICVETGTYEDLMQKKGEFYKLKMLDSNLKEELS